MYNQDDKRMEEIIYFLSLCGKKDREFLDIPQKERKTEDYARLIVITMIFDFKRVCFQLVGNAGKRMKEVTEIIKIVSGDYQTVKMWMDEFIENITIPELKKETQNFWQDTLKQINKENFKIKQLLK